MESQPIVLSMKSYTANICGNWLELDWKGSAPAARLYLPSGIDTPEACEHLESFALVRHDTEVRQLTFCAQSNLWKKHFIYLRYNDDGLEMWAEVQGEGAIDCVHYFGSQRPDFDQIFRGKTFQPFCPYQRPQNETFIGSRGEHRVVFSPQPNGTGRHEYPAGRPLKISLMNDFGFECGNFYFMPAASCFVLGDERGWMGAGIIAPNGQYNFTDYDYCGDIDFYFSLHFDGHTSVHGRWQTPKICLFPSDSEENALKFYSKLACEAAGVQYAQREDLRGKAIFCGWGEQSYLGRMFLSSGSNDCIASSYCTLQNYQCFFETLDEQKIPLDIVAIDDKWMKYRGNVGAGPDPGRWRDIPSMRALIDQQHAKGRKVLLWFPLWRAEGLPQTACVHHDGKSWADPTNPEYQKILIETLQLLISPDEGCLNADGLKLDFIHEHPFQKGVQLYNSNHWGLEVIHQYQKLIYDTVHSIKKTAIIESHTVHPYFLDSLDIIRLNDFGSDLKSITDQMMQRSQIARSLHSNIIIDSDNWPCPSLAAWKDYMRNQHKIGNPALYYAGHIDATGEAFDEEAYQILRSEWRR